MAFTGSKRRVFPVQAQTPQSPNDDSVPTAVVSAAQRSLLPPKSPLHGARVTASLATSSGGFERMLLLRNMNVSVPLSGAAEGTISRATPSVAITTTYAVESPFVPEVSAAHNLKERKLAEARRRAEVQMMTEEDYTNKPEGDARRRRQDERAHMREEELRMQRVVQHEHSQRRAAQLQKQADEEAKIKEMYLQKRRQELEEQERIAKEKEAERKLALETKMKALKEEADRKAREEYAARQKKLADEAQAERDVRTAAMESVLMHLEDALADAVRVQWLAEQERQRQIEAEALEWKLFEEKEVQRQREETQRRRDAQKEQYEEDRARRMQIHKLQQDRVRTAATDKRRREEAQQGDGATVAASLERLQSQCYQANETPSIVLPLSVSASVSTENSIENATRDLSPTERRPPTALETARIMDPTQTDLDAIVERTVVPPPPVFAPSELVSDLSTTVSDAQADCERVGVDQVSDETVFPVENEGATDATEEAATTVDDTPPPEATIPAEPAQPQPAQPTDRILSGEEEAAQESQPLTLPPTTEGQKDTCSDTPTSVDSFAGPSPPVEDLMVIHPELLSLAKLRDDCMTPVAEVLSVTAGSPSSVAGLAPRDLLVDFGGITSAMPKCIVAIATCVQQNVNQKIALTVLRPAESTDEENERMMQRCELWLVPRKWKGKGLLGCQLSPFKWATTEAAGAAVEPHAQGDEDRATGSDHEALVLHQVESNSLADRLGLLDGDVLARCGDLDVSRTGATVSDALAAVATHLQTHWRAVQRELPLVIQRWDESMQNYAAIHVVLPVPPTTSEPLGCALTSYSQYYYPSTTTTTTATSSACDECYYTSLASSLHAAALSGHVACLQALLTMCSSEFLDWRDDEGRSPLFYACYARQADAAQYLIRQLLATSGAYDPVSGADAYGDSPLHAAAGSDCVDIIECLLDTKFIADVDLANSVSQATAAHVAASHASLQVLHSRFHADLLALDADGRMPLFYACLRNEPASVAFLCELHPDFADYADSAGGNTPLHMAAWCGYEAVVHTLIKWLPDIALFVHNQDGLDARALALQSGWCDVAQELERRMVHD